MAGNIGAFLAEFIGTFILVFISAGSVCVNSITNGRLGIVGIAFAYSLTLVALMFTYGRASGGHYNPALTIVLWLHRKTPSLKTVFYVGAQLLGATAAALMLKATLHPFPDIAGEATFLGACDLSGIGYKSGTFFEAIIAFLWVSAYYGTTTQTQGIGPSTPTAVGAVVTAGVLILYPLTGAAFNPARQFGPAIVTGYWNHWYVYWIGPLAGAALAAWIYESLYSDKKN